ncbi:hypothetical protein AGLY_006918, partial [Aphis glycines]
RYYLALMNTAKLVSNQLHVTIKFHNFHVTPNKRFVNINSWRLFLLFGTRRNEGWVYWRHKRAGFLNNRPQSMCKRMHVLDFSSYPIEPFLFLETITLQLFIFWYMLVIQKNYHNHTEMRAKKILNFVQRKSLRCFSDGLVVIRSSLHGKINVDAPSLCEHILLRLATSHENLLLRQLYNCRFFLAFFFFLLSSIGTPRGLENNNLLLYSMIVENKISVLYVPSAVDSVKGVFQQDIPYTGNENKIRRKQFFGFSRFNTTKLMESLVLNFQLLTTYTTIFMNYTYKMICKYSYKENA